MPTQQSRRSREWNIFESGLQQSRSDQWAPGWQLLRSAKSTQLYPITPAVQPLQPIPLTKPNQAISAFDYNFTTPYIQNLTLSLTRDLTRNVSLDLRYIGTRGLKLDGNWDLNTANVYYNPDCSTP